MRRGGRVLACILLSAFPFFPAGLEKPKFTMINLAAERLDGRLARMSPADDPVAPVGLTQGAYIPGYGVVFMGTLNLAPMAGISPFHQSISKEEIARIHHKKLERVPKLKEVMQEQLVNMAASMGAVQADDQIVIAISLFHVTGEDTSGIPAQIVMRAPRRALLDRASVGTSVRVDEF